MRCFRLTQLTLAVAFATAVAPAAANILLFDLTGDANIASDAQPLVISQGGVDLSITGWGVGDGVSTPEPDQHSPFAALQPRGLSLTTNGLGVFDETAGPDSTQLDGSGPEEVLRLQFSKAVLLTKVVFALVDSNDEFDFGVGPDLNAANVVDVRTNQTYGNDRIASVATPLGLGTNPAADYELDIGPSVNVGPTASKKEAPKGKTFEFYTTNANDNYKIASIQVEMLITPDVVVPEPTTLGLLALMTGGIAFTTRRSNRS